MTTPLDVNELNAILNQLQQSLNSQTQDVSIRTNAYLRMAEMYRDAGASEGAIEQLLIQVQITSYGGAWGAMAIIGNYAAQQAGTVDENGAVEYNLTLDRFSTLIVLRLVEAVIYDIANGGDGVLSQDALQDLDYSVWVDLGLGDLFPGNLQRGTDEGGLDADDLATVQAFLSEAQRTNESDRWTNWEATLAVLGEGPLSRLVNMMLLYYNDDGLGRTPADYGFTENDLSSLSSGQTIAAANGEFTIRLNSFGVYEIRDANEPNKIITVIDPEADPVGVLRRLGLSALEGQLLGAARYSPEVLEQLIDQLDLTPEEADQLKNSLGVGLDGYGVRAELPAEHTPPPQCFLAGTPILMADGATKPIEAVEVGDFVLAFDRFGDLQPKRVTQLHRNISRQVLQLSNGLWVTPGHHFLNERGEFEEISAMLARGARIVGADGKFLEVSGKLLEAKVYADGRLGAKAGGEGWPTFNFTVEDLHTYIAGGVRVHNLSILATVPRDEIVLRSGYTDSGDQFALSINRDFHRIIRIGETDENGDTTLLSRTVSLISGAGAQAVITTTWTNFDANNDPVGEGVIDVEFPNAIISGEEIGRIFGTQLGSLLLDDNDFAGLGASVIGQIAANIGETFQIYLSDISEAIKGTTLSDAAALAFDDFGVEIQDAGIGAISSYLTAEFFNALGLEGELEGIVESGVSGVVGTIGQNLTRLGQPILVNGNPVVVDGVVQTYEWDTGLDVAGIENIFGNAIGAYFGAKLAGKIISADTVAGQIGGSLGGSVGSLVAGRLIGSTVSNAIGSTLGAIVVPFIGAFIGTLLGTVIGDLFGKTPQSGADLDYDSSAGEFIVGASYKKGDGSRETAEALASQVGEAINGVLGFIGGKVLNPWEVEPGHYGMRKSIFQYKTKRDGGAINFTEAGDLVTFGTFVALEDMKILGGDVILKRALAQSLANQKAGPETLVGGVVETAFRPAEFDSNELNDLEMKILLGDLSVAQDYAAYLENAPVINALIAAEPDSAFAAGWIITLRRAYELGLHRRHESDWYGGWDYFLDEENAAALTPAFSVDAVTGERLITLTDTGGATRVIGDNISSSGKDAIAGTAAAETITINGAVLDISASGAGVTVNGEAPAEDYEIDTAAVIHGGGGNDTILGGDRGNDLYGEGGNDSLVGGANADWLFGGAGDDILRAGASDDGNYLSGDDGNDFIEGAGGSDWLAGGAGADTLEGGDGGDILDGGTGGDAVSGERGDDTYIFRRGDGADALSDLAFADNPGEAPVMALTVGQTVYGRIDAIDLGHLWANWSGSGAAATPAGAAQGGDDTLVLGEGISFADLRIYRDADGAGTADDLIIEVWQNDVQTADVITLTDWFDPFNRVEWLELADGQRIRIGDFRSFTVGTAGNDILVGTGGADFVHGGAGNDIIQLLTGGDVGVGGLGDDMVSGDGGADLVIGGNDNDYLLGGDHNDVVSGDAGDDELDGGDGNDIVAGGLGDDTVSGGSGDDFIRFNRGDGKDVVFDALNSADWVTIHDGSGWINTRIENVDHDGNPATPDLDLRVYDDPGGPLDGAVLFDGSQYIGDYRTTVSGGLQWHSTGARADEGEDTLEFAIGIDVQDLVFNVVGDDLSVGVFGAGPGGDKVFFADLTDQIELEGWFAAQGGAAIEQFSFFNTGRVDAASFAIAGGTDDADALNGTSGKDWLTGGAGDDDISGAGGEDLLAGHGGQDAIFGGAGTDTLLGGSGDDTLTGGDGADILVGGDGFDIASYADSTTGVDVTLVNQETFESAPATDLFSGVEGLEGSGFADTLRGDGGDNDLIGGGADDILEGGAGADSYIFNSGDGSDRIADISGEDTLVWLGGESLSNLAFARTGDDLTVSGASGSVTVENHFAGAAVEDLALADGLTVNLAGISIGASGGSGDDFVLGGAGGDSLTGGDGADALSGAGGADTLAGGLGDDILEGGGGADALDGGDGADTVRYLGSAAGVTVDLATGAASGGEATGDSFVGIENVAGSQHSDNISGDAANNQLFGFDGADSLSGGAGDDIARGGAGGDTLTGGDGSDALYGDEGADSLEGGAGVDQLFGGDDDDVLIAGDDNDVADGGAGADQIDGGDGDDNLLGGAGDDTIDGGLGADILVGGAGNDLLRGGAGNDLHIVELAAGGDVVADGLGENDILVSDASHDELIFTRSGNDLVVTSSAGGSATVDEYFGANSGALRTIRTTSHTLYMTLAAPVNALADGASATAASMADYWVAGENSAPTDITIDGPAPIPENTDGAVIGAVVVTDGDAVPGESHVLSVDDARFEIINGDLRLKAGQTLDFESEPTVQLTITATDLLGSGLSYEKQFLLPVADGVDTLNGSGGDDVISGFAGAEIIYGAAGSDTLNGLAGPDTLYGEDGNDLLNGGAGDDLILGGAGDDILEGGEGADVLDGGAGHDSAAFENAAAGVAVDLNNGSLNLGDAFGDSFTDIEQFIGSAHADSLYGAAGDDAFFGGGGDDALDGRGGADMLAGGAGADTLLGDAGDDTLRGGAGADVIDGGDGFDIADYGDSAAPVLVDLSALDGSLNSGDALGDVFIDIEGVSGGDFNDALLGAAADDYIDGAGGDDSIQGGAGADELLGGDGDDSLQGGVGDDLLRGGAGADIFDGGGGFDVVSFDDSPVGVALNLQDSLLSTGFALGDSFVNVEEFHGTNFNDTLRGSVGDDRLFGLGGDDVLESQGAGAGAELLHGGAGDDTLFGGDSGTTYLYGGAGADEFVGGAGLSVVTYEHGAQAITLDLESTTGGDFIAGAGSAGEAAGDTFLGSIDQYVGTNFGDLMIGAEAGDLFTGGAGDDTLQGDAGNDWLRGSSGADRLEGGDGDDTLYGDEDTGPGAGDGDDYLDGGAGDDLLVSEGGADTLMGGAGADTLYAGDGEDLLDGGDGNDQLFGHGQSDTLKGGLGDDSLEAGAGGDKLWGGVGADTLVGDSGADIYIFEAGDGTDVVNAFNPQGTPEDSVAFVGADRYDLWFEKSGVDLVISRLGTTDTVTIASFFDAAGEPQSDFAVRLVQAGGDVTAGVEGAADLDVNVSQLVDLMASMTKPASAAALTDTERAAIDQGWAANTAPTIQIGGVDAAATETFAFDEDTAFSLDFTLADAELNGLTNYAALLEVGEPVIVAGAGDVSSVVLSAPNGADDPLRRLTVTPSANAFTAPGEDPVTVALSVGDYGLTSDYTFEFTIEPVVDALLHFGASKNENASGLVATLSLPAHEDILGTPTFAFASGGNPGGAFTIVGDELRLAAPLDFENLPAGFASDGTATVSIKAIVNNATYGVLESPVTAATVTINDVNEAPNVANKTFSMAENRANDYDVGTITASDPDTPGTSNANLRYYFQTSSGGVSSTSSDGKLTINATTGLVETNGANVFNYEAFTSRDYTLVVRDRAGGSGYKQDTATLTVNITNVNETPNVANKTFSMAENRPNDYNVGTITASDPDTPGTSDANLRYYFQTSSGGVSSTSSDGKLTINATTGLVQTNGANAFNYEAFTSRNYTVAVRDRAGGSGYKQDTATLTVNITNINDNPVRLQSSKTYAASENINPSTALNAGNSLLNYFSDEDSGANGSLTIEWVSNPDSDGDGVKDFTVTSAGYVFLNDLDLDYEDDTQHTLTVRARDGGNKVSANLTVNINVQDGDDLISQPNSSTVFGLTSEASSQGYHVTYYAAAELRDSNSDIAASVWSGWWTATAGYYLEYYDEPYPGFSRYQVWRAAGTAFPIVIDLDGDGVEIEAIGSHQLTFDIDNDGAPQRTDWVGADDGLLVLDRNGDGSIDNGSEISFVGDLPGAETDLEGLAAYDSNSDGVLDAADERFGEFVVWRDANQDAISQAHELMTLAEAGVVSLDLTPSPTGIEVGDPVDAVILNTATFTRADGSTGEVGDAVFRYATREDGAGADAAPPAAGNDPGDTNGFRAPSLDDFQEPARFIDFGRDLRGLVRHRMALDGYGFRNVRTVRTIGDDIGDERQAAFKEFGRRALPAFPRPQPEIADEPRLNLDAMFDRLREAMSDDAPGPNDEMRPDALPRIVGEMPLFDEDAPGAADRDASLNRLLQAMSTFGAGGSAREGFLRGQIAPSEDHGMLAVNASI